MAELALISLVNMLYTWKPAIKKEAAGTQSIDAEASYFEPKYQADEKLPTKTHYLGNIVSVAFGSLDYRNQHTNEYIPERSFWNPSTWRTLIQPGDMAYPIQRKALLELPSIEQILKEMKQQKIEEFERKNKEETGFQIAKSEKTEAEKRWEKAVSAIAEELKKWHESKEKGEHPKPAPVPKQMAEKIRMIKQEKKEKSQMAAKQEQQHVIFREAVLAQEPSIMPVKDCSLKDIEEALNLLSDDLNKDLNKDDSINLEQYDLYSTWIAELERKLKQCPSNNKTQDLWYLVIDINLRLEQYKPQ